LVTNLLFEDRGEQRLPSSGNTVPIAHYTSTAIRLATASYQRLKLP
jgi:hypothetical protein